MKSGFGEKNRKEKASQCPDGPDRAMNQSDREKGEEVGGKMNRLPLKIYLY
jgi:hypothetical protein